MTSAPARLDKRTRETRLIDSNGGALDRVNASGTLTDSLGVQFASAVAVQHDSRRTTSNNEALAGL
jgi:hypothetical protein